MIITISTFLAACTSNNASKLKEAKLFEGIQKSQIKFLKPELHVIFQINESEVELVEVLPSNIKRKNLVNLLKKNEGKNLSKGDTLIDCIILTNGNISKPCFESVNKNIPKNSIFHDSEVSGTMMVMTVFVPYLVFAAASDEDFYVENKIDGELVNTVGVALKRKIFDMREKIHQSLLTYEFSKLPELIRPYGQLIDHNVLIKSINNSRILSQLDSVEKILNGIDYEGFIVKSTEINQRKKPTIRSKVQTTHKRGELIFSESSKGDWIYNGEGWIYKKILLSLNDDTRTKLLHKRNNLILDNNYQNLLSGNSIASIDKVLNNKTRLVGVSENKVKALKSRKYQLIDENEYKSALNKNNIVAYERYLTLQPNGKYIYQVKRAILQLKPSKSKNVISNNLSNIDEGKLLKCAVLTWGPDACGMLVQLAADYMEQKVFNIASSPICSEAVSDALGHQFTKGDLKASLLTGGLDDFGDSGLDSEDFIMNSLGFASKVASFGVKYLNFEKCTHK